MGLRRQSAPPLLHGHAEVLDLVGLHGSEAGDLVIAEDDEALDLRIGDLGAPPVREHLAREREPVLREDPGQARDRRGFLHGHHRGHVVDLHRTENRGIAGHGFRLRGSPIPPDRRLWIAPVDCRCPPLESNT